MLNNELLFALHATLLSGFALAMLRLGREALVATMCMYTILSNLLVTKQMTLLGMDTICTDVFTIGSVLCLNLLQEYYGKAVTQRAISINFACMLVYLVLGQLHLAYTPNQFDTMQQHFVPIITPMLRIIIVSVLSYLLTQLFDSYFYGLLKARFPDGYLLSRNLLSLATSQLLDTVIFSYGALYGTVHSVGSIIVISYIIKLAAIACTAPFITISHYFVAPRHHD